MSKRLNIIHKIKEEHVMVHHSTSSGFMVRPPVRGSRFTFLLLSSTKKRN